MAGLKDVQIYHKTSSWINGTILDPILPRTFLFFAPVFPDATEGFRRWKFFAPFVGGHFGEDV